MTDAILDAAPAGSSLSSVKGLRLIVLARLSVEDGATRSELVRDVGSFVQGGKARDAIDVELAALVRAALVTENRSRFRVSEAGNQVLARLLDLKVAAKGWAELRDTRLVAKSLGIEGEAASRIKGLARPDRLRAEILAATFGFKLRGGVSPTKLRSELALVALERAFGQRIKSAVSTRNGFNAKTARLLAGQLLAKPRDVGTDSRLVALLAAEAVGSSKPDPDALRLALLRRFSRKLETLAGTPALAEAPVEVPPPIDAAQSAVPDSNGIGKPPSQLAPEQPKSFPAAAARPGLEGFAKAVQGAAKDHADGWPGSRKAFVSLVWLAISERHPEWGLSPIEFKAMLAEAHRTGHLVLATADLKDRGQLKKLQDSAIHYKNTVWHLIRVVE